VECHPFHAQSAFFVFALYFASDDVAGDAERDAEALWCPLRLELGFAALAEPGAFLIRTEAATSWFGFC